MISEHIINLLKERRITLNSAMENKTNHIHEDKEKEKEFLRDIKTDKGDIDDYIFSWQTVKMFSER